jgi:hypothetical protein
MTDKELLEQIAALHKKAHERLQTAAQGLQRAQQEHNVASQEFMTWQNALIMLQKAPAQPPSNQPPTAIRLQIGAAANVAQPAPGLSAETAQNPSPPAQHEEINKTDAVREILRQHPQGIRPTEIWKQLGSQFKDRAYLYSILKRLKDKQQVCERRGKYYVKAMPKIEGEERISVVVQ